MKNSQFVPLYTELYHYYETHSVSFTNTDEFLIIQIPIFFINNKQAPMDLYKLHTVHVPLDKDTYGGKESKYTRLDLKQNHLAISKEEYIDLTQHQLNSCLKLHTDYLCPNLRLTASTHVLSCAADILCFRHLQMIILYAVFASLLTLNILCRHQLYWKHKMKFYLPTCLLNGNWYVITRLIDRYRLTVLFMLLLTKMIYVLVVFQHNIYFSYESMRTCTTPDASVTLYYTHNKTLLAYDTSLKPQKDKDDEQYSIKVPEYRAPDISYQKKMTDVERSSDIKVRKKKKHSKCTETYQ